MGVIPPYFQSYYDLPLKSKAVGLFGYYLKVSSEPNSISHGGHLTLFQPLSHLDEYFVGCYDLDLKIVNIRDPKPIFRP